MTTISLDQLPESIREDYSDIIIEEFRKNRCSEYTHHSILITLFKNIINKIVEESAKTNAIEFIRYKKLLSDAHFALIFGGYTISKEDQTKLLDLLEEMKSISESNSYYSNKVDTSKIISQSLKIKGDKNGTV